MNDFPSGLDAGQIEGAGQVGSGLSRSRELTDRERHMIEERIVGMRATLTEAMEQCSAALVEAATLNRMRGGTADQLNGNVRSAIRHLVRRMLVLGSSPSDAVGLVKHLAAGAGWNERNPGTEALSDAVVGVAIEAYFEL